MDCRKFPQQRYAGKTVKGPSTTPGTDFKKANQNIMEARAKRLPAQSKLSGEVGVSKFDGFAPNFCAPGKDPFKGNYEGVSSLSGGFVPSGRVKTVSERDYSIYDKRPKALTGTMVDMFCSTVRKL